MLLDEIDLSEEEYYVLCGSPDNSTFIQEGIKNICLYSFS